MEYKNHRIRFNEDLNSYEICYSNQYINFDTEKDAKKFIDSILTESLPTNYATSIEEDFRDNLGYTILTKFTLADVLEETEYIDDPDSWDKLTQEQVVVLKDLGYRPYGTQYPIKFLNSTDVEMMPIDRAIDCLYSKNGFDLVEFSDGDIGFLSTQDDNKSGFKIISDTSKYEIDESYDYEYSDAYDFHDEIDDEEYEDGLGYNYGVWLATYGYYNNKPVHKDVDESKKKKKDTDIDYMKDVEGSVKAFNNINANVDGTEGLGGGLCC